MDVNSVPQPHLKWGNYRTVLLILLGFFWENYGDSAMKFFPNSLELNPVFMGYYQKIFNLPSRTHAK